MSINIHKPIVPLLKLKMLNEQTKLIGIPKSKIQVIITLTNILDFNKELKETITMFQDISECFIITSSPKAEVINIAKSFALDKAFISLDFKEFAERFNLKTIENSLKKSLIIINKDCQVTHKNIL